VTLPSPYSPFEGESRRRRQGVSVLAIVVFLLAPSLQAQRYSGFQKTVEAIALSTDAAGRRDAIVGRLKSDGVEHRLEEFTARQGTGVNIVASVRGSRRDGGAKIILSGAHYDRAARGQGAVDNGASCAALLELLAELQAKPLVNYDVTVAFFDLEERGLLGSRAHFDALSERGGLPSYAANLDIFAYGETLYATASKPDGPLAAALQTAAGEAGMPLRLHAEYPGSDHRSMIAAGVETLGVTLIDGNEIDGIVSLLQKKPGAEAPPILKLIHTDADVLDRVRAEDVQKAIPVLVRLLRLLDRL